MLLELAKQDVMQNYPKVIILNRRGVLQNQYAKQSYFHFDIFIFENNVAGEKNA
jgi:hypothetical protein